MKKPSFFKELWRSIFKEIQKTERSVYIRGACEPPNHFSNVYKNQKTNVITILPVFLYNEFKFFFNLFFLLITISQFFEALKVGLLVTYVAPLAIVLGLSFLKEVVDEIKRYLKDKKYNSEKYM